jgi:hypothetical protein
VSDPGSQKRTTWLAEKRRRGMFCIRADARTTSLLTCAVAWREKAACVVMEGPGAQSCSAFRLERIGTREVSARRQHRAARFRKR